jgi:protein-L-isoaspartate O-methyltransferase
VNWKPRAALLASEVTHPVSRWRPVVAAVPRHVSVPRWFERLAAGVLWEDTWELRDGAGDTARWAAAAYANRSLITQVGAVHADHAEAEDRPAGRPTSSATLPGLLVQMYRHAMISDMTDVLDVGTGSGYGTALLATRLGDARVVSVDVDDYLVKAAAARLASIGLHPVMINADAAGTLPGGESAFDRIVATVAVRPVPPSWLAALRPGGRLVTTIAGTNLIVTADRTPDGGAAGRTEWDRAGFMNSRSGPSYSPAMTERFAEIRHADGEHVSYGRFPVVNVNEAWELYSALGLIMPGIGHYFEQYQDGRRTAWMLRPDGSWARASAIGDEPPAVHQTGPRWLYDVLDGLRDDWLNSGSLPAYGAQVKIAPDGSMTFRRGRWSPASRPPDIRAQRGPGHTAAASWPFSLFPADRGTPHPDAPVPPRRTPPPHRVRVREREQDWRPGGPPPSPRRSASMTARWPPRRRSPS